MRIERSFNIQSSEAVLFRVSESTRTQNNNLEAAIAPREIILFSRVDEEKDTETPDQAPEINQTDVLVPVPVNGNWEPFNTEPHPSQNFVNLYGGPYSQQMELNRRNAERVLEVAGIEGKVIIVDLPMERSRSIAGVNPDGSVTARRRLFWGEKIQDEDKSQSLVKSIPQGWRIEIPGQDILEDLTRKESKKPLDKRFITRVNQSVRDSIREIIFREKMSSEKDKLFKARLISFVVSPISGLAFAVGLNTILYIFIPIYVPVSYAAGNFFELRGEGLFRGRKKISSMYEIIMPPVEFDRVFRGILFVNIKGRNLVRLRPDGTKTSAR